MTTQIMCHLAEIRTLKDLLMITGMSVPITKKGTRMAKRATTTSRCRSVTSSRCLTSRIRKASKPSLEAKSRRNFGRDLPKDPPAQGVIAPRGQDLASQAALLQGNRQLDLSVGDLLLRTTIFISPTLLNRSQTTPSRDTSRLRATAQSKSRRLTR